MPDSNSFKSATPHSDARFATTHWTVVLAAGSPDSSRYREALETLCGTYWFPLYAYLRRKGFRANEAEDYTQGFFTKLLDSQSLSRLSPGPAKFRSFLLKALKHFLTDDYRRASAVKRGMRKEPLSLDIRAGEAQYILQPTHDLSPERLFERSWALTVLDKVMDRLEDELISMGKQKLWDAVRPYLCGDADVASYQDVAVEVGTTEAAVKVTVYRLRRRFREILRDEIAQTVSTRQEIEEELQALLDAVM